MSADPAAHPGPPSFPASGYLLPDHVLHTMPWAVLGLDSHGVLRLVNPAAARLLGNTVATLQGQPLLQVLPPSFPIALRQAMQDALLGSATVTGTFFLPQTQQWIEMSTAPGTGQVLVFWQDVTRLLAQQRQYRTLTDTIPDVIMRWDSALRLRYANAALELKLGRPVAAVLGKTLAEMGVSAGTAAAYAAALARVLATGQPLDYHHRFATPQGERHYHSRLVPEWQAGAVHRVLDISRDVTTVVEAQAQLAAKETLLREAEVAAHSGSYEAELPDMAVRFSDGLFRLFGEEPQSFVPTGDFVRARSIPEDEPGIAAVIAEAVRTRSTFHYRRRIYRADGQLRLLEARGTVVCNAAGEPTKLLGLVHDVTERAAAEAQIRRAQRTIERMLAGSPAAICLLEARREQPGGPIIDFVFRGANHAAELLNQKTEAEMLGRGLLELFPGVRDVFFADYVRVIETGQPWRSERYYSGEHYHDRWLDVSAVKNGDGFIMTFLDVTAQKQSEERLAKANAWITALLNSSPARIGYYTPVHDAAGTLVDFTVDTVSSAMLDIIAPAGSPKPLLSQVLPGIQQHSSWPDMQRVMETGQAQRHEHRFDFPAMEGWFDVAYTRLADGFFTQALEITARKQAEQELVKNLALLQQSEEVAQLGSWEYEPATGAFRWSAGMYRLFGLLPGTPVQPQIYQQWAIAEDQAVADRLVRTLQQGAGRLEETLRIRVAGQEKTLRIKAELLPQQPGQPARLLGVDLDISAVQRLEAENLRIRLGQQQALFDAVLETQEAERKRMAESLHNGVGQLLYATKLRLDQLPVPTLPFKLAARNEADQLLSEAIRQTRALSHELVPTVLEEFGLEAAFQDICRHLSSPRLRLRCQVMLDAEVPALPPTLQLALYRMAQELAQNIVKHAHGATEASLELETTPGFALLRAEDNGPGFTTEASQSTGLGLRTIRHRTELLGGTVNVGSSAAFGTYVRIRIPLPAPVAST